MTPQSILPGDRHLKKFTLTGDALCVVLWHSPYSTWRNSTFLALKVSIMILMALPGLNVINATPHSTCNVGHGRQRELSGPSDFCVPFTVVDISKCVSLDFKMGRKPLCPNSPANNKAKQKRGKGKKNDDTARTPQPAPKASHQWTPSDMKGTGSSHKNQKIGQWSPISMRDALAEFDYYEERRIRLNLPRLEKHIA